MPYRVHAKKIARATTEPDESLTLARFDASGRAGQRGARGHDGAGGAYSGADGARGGDAGPAEPGQHAGSVRAELETTPAGNAVWVGGWLIRPDGRRLGLNQEIDFGDRGYVDLIARGGGGGAGGDGGSGGAGATGASGRDASRYSSGTDGGSGGDGGDGGNASSGAPGGRGGHIRVVVDERDTHLLMLIRQGVDGGLGGPPGRNGAGGPGGAGGRGGSSYSWTTTSSYTDSQGNRQTRTHYHSNPGGSSGASGVRGRPGAAPVHAGAAGARGTYGIEVKSGQQVREYPSRYDLRLVGFEHQSGNADEIYEPRERVHVRNIEVQNIGGMPTPAFRTVELGLQQQGWVIPRTEPLRLPKPLAPGERLCLTEGELCFEIGDYRPHGPGDALECPEVIRHRASVPDARRDFERYETDASKQLGAFVIRFPVRATTPEYLRALGPGEATRIRWSLSNLSSQPLGQASPSGRVVRLRLNAQQSELDEPHVALFDGRGRSVPFDQGVVLPIDELAPGPPASFEAFLAVRDDAPAYQSANLWLSVELGHLDDPGRARAVQICGCNVRVGRRYRAQPDADLLLVVNHRTTDEELGAWRALAEELGFGLNIWDLALQGGLDLESAIGGGPSLLEQFAGKTIVVLNNAIETAAGKTRPARFVHKDQLLQAAAAEVNLAVLGGKWNLKRLLVPTAATPEADPQTETDGSSPATLLAELGELEPTELARLRRRLSPVQWRLWGGIATEQDLLTRAYALHDELRNEHPERRFVVIAHFDPKLEAKTLWIKKVRLGTLEVRATVDTAAGTLVHAAIADERLHEPSYVQSDANVLTLLLTRGFDEKLRRLGALLARASRPELPAAAPAPDGASQAVAAPVPTRSSSQLLGLLVDALLVDLCTEQCALLGSGWRGGLSKAETIRAARALRRLGAFQRSAPAPLAPDSPAGTEIIRLAALLRLYADSQMRWWEWLPPLPWLRRAPRLRWLTRGTIDAFLAACFGPPAESDEDEDRWADQLDAARRLVKAQAKQLRGEYRRARKAGLAEQPTLAAHTRAMLVRPIEEPGITSDVELLTEATERVIGHEELEAIAARDGKHARRRQRLIRRGRDAAAELSFAPGYDGLHGAAQGAPEGGA